MAEVGLAGRVGRVAARVEHLDGRAESTAALERYREDGLVPAVSPVPQLSSRGVRRLKLTRSEGVGVQVELAV